MSTIKEDFGGADRPTQPHSTSTRTSQRGGGAPPPPPRRRDRRASAEAARASQHRRRRKIVRRVAAVVLVALLVPTVWSYYQAVSAAGTDPVTVRSVEWLKNNGMTGVVNSVEHWWYTHHAPPIGGKLKHGIPHSSGVSGTAQGKKGSAPVAAHLPPPAPIPPLVATPLAGEGIWTATGRTVQGLPAVYTTYFRPDAFHTSLVVAAMWMDTKLLNAELVPGLQEPGGPNPWGGMVPLDQRGALVAAFNSAFKVQDSRGGYYGFGQEIHPLVPGVASLVIDAAGKPNIGLWGRDFVMGPTIATVRQNLSLLVDHGQIGPAVASDSNLKWGATVGANVYVWRSGVGIDANGALIYVAGPGLSVPSLAVLLQRAGAVRAMELDINSTWTSGYTFVQPDPANPATVTGQKLLPGMQRSEDRYLVPGERDFFALLAAH